MDIYAVRANTFALQMKLIYAANKHLQHCKYIIIMCYTLGIIMLVTDVAERA